MKVLHIVPWYEPAWSAAGTATAVSNLCRSLASADVEVTVYTTNDAGGGKILNVPLEKPLKVGGVTVWYFPCGFIGRWKAAAYSRSMSKKISQSLYNYDIVHISGTRHLHGLFSWLAAIKSATPYIITPHASITEWWVKQIGMKIMKLFYMYLVDSWVVGNAAAIHYLTKAERLWSKKYDRGRPSFVVPNGIDVERYNTNDFEREKIRKTRKINNNTLVLLSLGRIHPQKNIHMVIEAMRIIIKDNRNILYWIVGPVSDDSYYKKLIQMIDRYSLQGFVRFVPPVNTEETYQWYVMSDLLVQPSKIEGLSMTIIEAMASSLPVLVSDRVGNAQEIIEDDAGMVIQAEPSAIRDSIVSIMKNKSILGKLSSNARRSAEKRYRMGNVASQMIKAYKNVLSGEKDESLNWT